MNKENILAYEDKIILNDDLSNYESSFGDERDSYFKRYVFENGDECVVYYPETITADTKVSTYYPGSGMKADWYSGVHGSGNVGLQDYLMMDGCDQIVLMPHSSSNASRDYIGAKVTTLMTEEYGLSTNNSWSGFSMGATPSLEAAVTYMELNPECEPQVVVQIDGYSSYNGNPNYMANGIAEDFINTGSIIVALDAKGKGNYLDHYAKAGINVVKVISDTDGVVDVNYGNGVKTENRGSQHVPINQDYFKDGFLQFASGDGTTLPSEGYTYYTWDSESASWKQIDISQIDTYEKLNEYFGNEISTSTGISSKALKSLASLADIKIASDDNMLGIYLNSIRNSIRNTSFLQGNFSASSLSSTTKVPSAIPDLVNQFFASNVTLLETIATDTEEFAKIGASIKELDTETALEAEQITETIDISTEAAVIGTTAAVVTQTQNQTTSQNTSTTTANKPENNSSTTSNTNATQKPTENQTSDKNTSSSNTSTSNPNKNQSTNQTSSTTTTNKTEQPSTNTTEEFDITKEFYDYDTLYSDDTKIVFNYKDEYKIIVHKDGDKITGIEYYYDYKTESAAKSAIETLTKEYSSVDHFDQVLQKDQYIKVLFKEDMFKDLTISNIKEKLSFLENLEEMIKL